MCLLPRKFLAGEIGFLDIADRVERAMSQVKPVQNPTMQDILDADCQWVTQIQAAYGALYRQLERGIGGFRSQRPEEAAGPIRGVQAAGALLSEMRQAIPRPESQAMSTHGRRGMEEARQLLG